MIAGTAPYSGESAFSIMMKHVSAPITDLRQVRPECPATLAAVLAKTMQKSPADRQQSYKELLADFRRAYENLNEPPDSAHRVAQLLVCVVSAWCGFKRIKARPDNDRVPDRTPSPRITTERCSLSAGKARPCALDHCSTIPTVAAESVRISETQGWRGGLRLEVSLRRTHRP